MAGLDVVVTVGMGRFPFDRLVNAVEPLCADHRVFAQTGTSKVVLSCEQRDFVSYDELVERFRRADVVVTHAGNTVRLVQRIGVVPVAVARRPELGEMADDHQVRYLELERRVGRVIALDDVRCLPEVVADHLRVAAVLQRERTLAPAVDPTALADCIDGLMRPFVQRQLVRRQLVHRRRRWSELAEGRQ